MQESVTSKEAVVLKLLSEGDTMVCLDARYPGVHVPPQHVQNPNLRLILNLNFPHPITVTADGISANMHVVFTIGCTYKTDFCGYRPAATVRTAGHANA